RGVAATHTAADDGSQHVPGRRVGERDQRAASLTTGSGSSASCSSLERLLGPPLFPSANAAFRTRPRRLVRLMGEPRNVSRNVGSSIFAIDLRSSRVPRRGSNSDQPRGRPCVVALYGQTSWQM